MKHQLDCCLLLQVSYLIPFLGDAHAQSNRADNQSLSFALSKPRRAFVLKFLDHAGLGHTVVSSQVMLGRPTHQSHTDDHLSGKVQNDSTEAYDTVLSLVLRMLRQAFGLMI